MWLGRDDRSFRQTPLPRLLVIDDEESICFSMSEYFSLHGYKVDTASEIEEAEKLCDRVAIIDEGRIVAMGTPGEIQSSVLSQSVIEIRCEEALPAGDGLCWRDAGSPVFSDDRRKLTVQTKHPARTLVKHARSP